MVGPIRAWITLTDGEAELALVADFGPDAEGLDVGRAPRRILTFGHGAHH